MNQKRIASLIGETVVGIEEFTNGFYILCESGKKFFIDTEYMGHGLYGPVLYEEVGGGFGTAS